MVESTHPSPAMSRPMTLMMPAFLVALGNLLDVDGLIRALRVEEQRYRVLEELLNLVAHAWEVGEEDPESDEGENSQREERQIAEECDTCGPTREAQSVRAIERSQMPRHETKLLGPGSNAGNPVSH